MATTTTDVEILKYGNSLDTDLGDITDPLVRKLVLFNYEQSAALALIEHDASLSPPTISMIDGKPSWRADGVKNNGDGAVLRAIVAAHYRSLPVQES
jgi:hypothetical protein